MSTLKPAKYPPLTRRHKRIFGLAIVAAVAVSAAIAWGRLVLVRWWLDQCTDASVRCHWTEIAVTWWWLLLVAVVLAIAAVADRLTADRLLPRQE